VLVGAGRVNGSRGAAYLYSARGSLLQTFTDPNNTANDSFGFSVAAVGSNVLVGAPGVNGYRGAAYLYDATIVPPLHATSPQLQPTLRKDVHFLIPLQPVLHKDVHSLSASVVKHNLFVQPLSDPPRGLVADFSGRIMAAATIQRSADSLQVFADPAITVAETGGITATSSNTVNVVDTGVVGHAETFFLAPYQAALSASKDGAAQAHLHHRVPGLAAGLDAAGHDAFWIQASDQMWYSNDSPLNAMPTRGVLGGAMA
jgi:hypothetical protein